VSWVPRRICGACPSRPGRWCQAERGRTTARMIRLDTTGPVCFPPGADAARDPGHSATTSSTAAHHTARPERNQATKPNRRGPPPSRPTRGHPLAVEPAGGPALEFRCPSNAAASRPHDACAVTRTCARSCPRTPPAASATRIAQPNCATQRILLKPVRSRKKTPVTPPQPHQHTSRNHPRYNHPNPRIGHKRPFLRLRAQFDDLAGGAVQSSDASRVGGRRLALFQARPRVGFPIMPVRCDVTRAKRADRGPLGGCRRRSGQTFSRRDRARVPG